jgi:hypothetical protein
MLPPEIEIARAYLPRDIRKILQGCRAIGEFMPFHRRSR